jgi:hypothetical protein
LGLIPAEREKYRYASGEVEEEGKLAGEARVESEDPRDDELGVDGVAQEKIEREPLDLNPLNYATLDELQTQLQNVKDRIAQKRADDIRSLNQTELQAAIQERDEIQAEIDERKSAMDT